MARTFFQDFEKDDGTPITVEYSVVGSHSPTTFSPNYGADGGDVPEFSILDSWPRSEEYNRLWTERNGLVLDPLGRERSPITISMMEPEEQEKLHELDDAIEAADKTAKLTDAECERMEAWIAEHYIEEPDEPEF